MGCPVTYRLLRRVKVRELLRSRGRLFRLTLLILAALYAALLLASRLLGLIPDWFTPLTLLLPVGLALLTALLLARPASAVRTAHLIDVKADARDLFLTTTLLENSSGDFKPLVLNQAEAVADGIKPSSVVSLDWHRGAAYLSLAMLLLVAGVLTLPQLDPFGFHEVQQRSARRRKRLDEARKLLTMRKTELKRKVDEASDSKEVKQALEELKKTFQLARRKQKTGNLTRLEANQKRLGQMWRKLSDRKLKEALARNQSAFAFGKKDIRKAADWKKQLKGGDLSGIKKELDELKELAEQLKQSADEFQKSKLAQEMKQRLECLGDCLAGEMGSKPLHDTLTQALRHLDMAAIDELAPYALEGLQEALDLAGLELGDLEQALGDLDSLENALKAIQLAKQLNELEMLDGGQCEGCEGIGDYAELYAMLMAQAGQGAGDKPGVGPGMGGPGIGAGGNAPEDSTLKTDFKSEKSASALQAGKLLLKWKIQELSHTGQTKQDYQSQLKKIEQGLSEAILREQVPPGYHEAIKEYFNSMDKVHETKPKR